MNSSLPTFTPALLLGLSALLPHSALAITINNENTAATRVFSSGYHTAPVRNTSPLFLATGIDLSAIALNPSCYGNGARMQHYTAISPMHLFHAKHFNPSNGFYGVEFFTAANTRVTATISDVFTPATNLANSGDLGLLRLQKPMPASDQVRPLRLLEFSNGTNLNGALVGLPILAFGSTPSEGTKVGKGTVGSHYISIDAGFSSSGTNTVKLWEVGDSGSPIVYVHQGEALLLGGAEAGNGSSSNLFDVPDGAVPYTPLSHYTALMAEDGYTLRWLVYDDPADSARTAQLWTGGGGSGALGTSNNWSPSGFPSGKTPLFDGSAANGQTTLLLGADRALRGLQFRAAPGTNGFNFSAGNTLTLGRVGILNRDADTQTFANHFLLDDHQTWEAEGGPMVVSGNIAPTTRAITQALGQSEQNGFSGQNAVHMYRFFGQPASGSFTITRGSETTAALPYNATRAQIDTALEAMPSMGAGTVSITRQPNGFRVEFTGSKAGTSQAVMTVTPSGMTSKTLLAVGGGHPVTLSGNLTGLLSVANNLENTLTLSGTNSCTGEIFANSGTLQFTGGAAFPSGAPLFIRRGTVNLGGNNVTAAFLDLRGLAGDVVNGHLNLGENGNPSNEILFLGGATGNASFSPNLSFAASTATTGSLFRVGPDFSGNVTFNGGVNINSQNGGRAPIDISGTLPDATASLTFNGAWSGNWPSGIVNFYLRRGTVIFNAAASGLTSANSIFLRRDGNDGIASNTGGTGTLRLNHPAALGSIGFHLGVGDSSYTGTSHVMRLELGAADSTYTNAVNFRNDTSGRLAAVFPSGTSTLNAPVTILRMTAAGVSSQPAIEVTEAAACLNLSNIVQDTGSGDLRPLIKTGSGVLALTRTSGNTYAGGTQVNGGTLLANNTSGSATGTGAVSVAEDAALGGTGSITGNVTVASGGKFAFTTSTAAGSHDKLDLSGSLTLSGTSTVVIDGQPGSAPGTYTLLTAAGGISGSLPSLSLPENWSATLQISGNNLTLVVTATTPVAPIVTASQSTSGVINSAFSYQILASGNPTSYALASGSLPSGVTLNTATGLLSGTPTTAGTYTPAFTATNTSGTSPAVVVTLTISASDTGLIVHEPFNYTLGTTSVDPDGAANSGNGLPAVNLGGSPSGTSTGLRGNYSGDHTSVAGLSYANAGGTLVTTANALRRTAGTGFSASQVFVYRTMTTDPFAAYRSVADPQYFGWNGSNPTQLYFSVLLNVNALNTGADNRLVLVLGTDNASWNVYPGQHNGTTTWGYRDQAGNSVVSLGAATANQTVLLVGRLNFNSATHFVTEYWLNPPLGQALGTPTYSKTFTTTTSGGQFRGIGTRDGANILTYDEVRLGTSLAAVTPHTVAGAPAAPSNLVASALSGSQIQLTWTDNASDESGFKLERSPNGTSDWSQIATPAADATSHTDTGLAGGTTYHYRLRATNVGGDSGYTNIASTSTWGALENWRITWFNTPANSGSAADSADPDGDGVTNAVEFSSGTDPLAPGAPATAPPSVLPARLVTLAPSTDAYVEQNNPNSNYPTGDLLVRSEGSVREAFLNYDLNTLSGTVERAQLVFWPTSTDSQSATYNVQRVADAGDGWSETGLTWNTKPASVPTGAASFTGPVSSGVPRVVDVTSLVADTLANDGAKQLGVRLFATGSMPSAAAFFGSRENSGTYRVAYLHITLRPSVAAPVRLLHVGDSITRGSSGGISSNSYSHAGYRYYLHNQLLAAGVDFRAVGPRVDGSISAFRLLADGSNNSALLDRPLPFPANAGYSGYSLGNIRDNIGAWVSAGSPDVVTLMIGTNNVDYSQNPSLPATPSEINGWKNAYIQILDNLLAASSTTKVVLGTIPPVAGAYSASNANRIEPFNTEVVLALYAQYSTAHPGRFFLVDNYAALSTSDIAADGVHPTSPGHQKLARTTLPGLLAALGRTDTVRFANQGAGADATLRGGTLSSTPLGNATTPLVPGWTNALLRVKADPSANNRAKTLVKFDLAGLPLLHTAATLGFVYHGNTPAGGLAPAATLLHLYGVKPGADSWTKSAVTWESAPGHDPATDGVLTANTEYLASVTVPADARTGDLVTFSSDALQDFLSSQVGGDALASFVVVASGRESAEVVLHASNQGDYQPPFLLLTPIPVPAAPSDLALVGLSSSAVELAWVDHSSDETAFKLERSLDGSTGWVQIAAPASNTTSHIDSQVSPGTDYYYRVRASNASGNSAYSGVLSVTTLTPVENWFAQYALPLDTSLEADNDNDGFNNLLEFAVGGDPTASESAALVESEVVASKLSLSYVRTASDVNYIVEASSDLVTWTPLSFTPVEVGETQVVEDTVDLSVANPSRRFLRLRVTLP